MTVLLAALQGQELTATHEFTIQPTGSAASRRSLAASSRDRSVDVQVDVDPIESAVVLVEQDGEFTWHFPEPAAVSARRGARKGARRGAASKSAVAAPSTVTIPIRLHARARRTARGRRSFGIGSVLSAAKGVVLKFIARTAAGVVMHQLERNVRKGIIVMDSDDPLAWRRVETLGEVSPRRALLTGEPLRVMLWVHGTFSSTAGAFGALTSTTEGKALLAQAREHYDVVIGYDHPTLSETPLENAVDLMERLGRFSRPMRLDVVTHSRGGLVYRSLIELLLPTAASRPEIGSAVFVGVPNAGTLLAEPENWHTLVDLYTNLAVGAFRLLQLVPQAAAPARILAEIISGLGAFLKYLADVIVTERRVPGLAAQEPKGEFIKKLNAAGAGQPRPEETRYLAVTSNFDSKAAKSEKTGLAASVLGRLADGLIDRLFGEQNDLVVNDPSMKRIDPELGNFIDAALDFGDSAVVYHTVYFAQPQVAQQLRAWLLDESVRHGLAARPGLLTVNPSPRSPFTRVRYHIAHAPTRPVPSESVVVAATPARRGARRGARRAAVADAGAAESLESSQPMLQAEAEAQLESLFGHRVETPVRRGVAGVAAPHPVRNYAPKLQATTTQVSHLDEKRRVHLLSFAQTHREIKIFGTRAVVELDDNGNLIAAQAKLANVTGVEPTPRLAADAAAARLAETLKLVPIVRKQIAGQQPELTFFHDRPTNVWHLAYLFRDVPALPPKNGKSRATKSARKTHRDGHGIGPSPRQRFPRLDYLVDANDGSLVYYYSVTPTAAKKAPMNELPGKLSGKDDEGNVRRFFGLATKKGFALHDPTRFVRTHDLKLGDIDQPVVLGAPITASSPSGPFDSAGVSAHVNSGIVFDFFNSVLLRKGVDDKGMEVINIVNCTSPADEPPNQWGNAVWWNKKMWYGQMIHGTTSESLARHLDIIAHELTHGVTETTCDLVYRDESGALNESFSDIFGVIISNMTKQPGVDPRGWEWQIGRGLGEKRGKPLRDMSNPALTGDPAHTKDMLRLAAGELPNDDNDMGGVHTNSNIHNKAAFNVLTATLPGAKGKNPPLVFDPKDVAQMYYWTLQRLDRVATFEDVYFTLLDVTRTLFPDPTEQATNLAAVTEAYAKVGIPRPSSSGPAPARPARKKASAKDRRARTRSVKRSAAKRGRGTAAGRKARR